MPHIDIKSFPRHFDEEQKKAIAQALTDLVVMHFDSRPDAVSIALSYVQPEQWKEKVWEPEIVNGAANLIKSPGYTFKAEP